MPWVDTLGSGTIGPLGTIDGFALDRGQGVLDADAPRVVQAIDVASGIVRRAAGGQVISLVSETITITKARGHRRIFLPQIPVVSIDSVTVDGDTWVAGEDYLADLETGVVEAQARGCFPRLVACAIAYTHGYDPIPAEIQGIVYDLAQRLLADSPGQPIQAETIGGYSVQYGEGGSVGLSALDMQVIQSVAYPVVAL